MVTAKPTGKATCHTQQESAPTTHPFCGGLQWRSYRFRYLKSEGVTCRRYSLSGLERVAAG